MEQATIALIVLASLALKGAVILALAYVGARLAIRHERRSQAPYSRPQRAPEDSEKRDSFRLPL